MDISTLRINQLSAEGWEWYQRYLDALDAYDIDRYATFLSEDVVVRFNDAEPIVGRAAAVGGLGAFWSSVRQMGWSLVHQPLNIYGSDSAFAMEALNHYDSADGRRVTVRAVALTDRDADGKVTSVRLFHDLSPLYAPAPAV